MTGTVSNILSSKGFGFITGDNGQEYFFHQTDMVTSWDKLITNFSIYGPGKIKMEFEPERTPKGPRARDVTEIQ